MGCLQWQDSNFAMQQHSPIPFPLLLLNHHTIFHFTPYPTPAV